jgi:alpha-D-xyloside xylohydrolase
MTGDGTVFEAFTKVTGWGLEGPDLTLRLGTRGGGRARLVARAISPETWKISIVPAGASEPRPTPMVVLGNAKPVRLSAREANGRLSVSGPELRLDIRLDPFDLRFVDRRGRGVLAGNPGDVDGLGRQAVPPMGIGPGPGGGASITAAFRLAPGERLYGLGEKFTRLDKAGQRLVSWTVDALGSTSERSHKNVPFLWSDRGFGLFVDTGARVAWDLGATSLQSWTFRADCPALDLYVFHGPAPARILGAYTALTGRAPAVPGWSFGLWLSSGGTYRDQASIERLLDGIGRHRLPAGVVHIDPWWMRWRRYCDFEWDRRAFPDPEGLVRRVHALGLKLCLWEHPYVSVESPLYREAEDKGYFVRRPDGSTCVVDYGLSLAPRPDGAVRLGGQGETWNAPVAIVDLTFPEARAWFKDLHRPLLRMGVDVFKTDFGEDVPADAVFRDGRTGAELHNLYPLLYNEAVFEVTAEENGRGLVWGRSATAGSQRFPVVWSGDPASDWDSLAATIRGGLSAGMSGLALWSHDIGGYRGRPGPELYVRWAQFGLLSSHSRMHGDSPREPWHFSEEALAIVRKFAGLRYRLFPYIRSAALEAGTTGMPVLRALPLVFPDDPNGAAWDHEYLFGPSLLVAPVIRPLAELARAGGRPAGRPLFAVYLPPGEWIDYWTGKAHSGPAVVEVPAPLDVLPLFARAGAVVPMMRRATRIPDGPVDPLELGIYPAGASAYALFEEEGRTEFRLEPAKGGFDLHWSGPVRRRIVVRAGGRAAAPAIAEIPASRSERGVVRLRVRPSGSPAATSRR